MHGAIPLAAHQEIFPGFNTHIKSATGAAGANLFRGDGDLPPSRDQVQGQNRREKGRHLGGETGGNFTQHRRLCGDRSDGCREDAHAHSRALSLSEPENQFVLHLYSYRVGRVVPFHRRTADRVGDRVADGYHRAEAGARSGAVAPEESGQKRRRDPAELQAAGCGSLQRLQTGHRQIGLGWSRFQGRTRQRSRLWHHRSWRAVSVNVDSARACRWQRSVHVRHRGAGPGRQDGNEPNRRGGIARAARPGHDPAHRYRIHAV